MTKPIRVALISSVPPLRDSIARGLSAYCVQIVSREMQDFGTNSLNMLRRKPHVILVDGIPQTPEEQISFKRFQEKVRRKSSARILIRTDLSESDPSVEEAIRRGISVVDASTNLEHVVQIMQSLKSFKGPFKRFENHKVTDLESFGSPPNWEREHNYDEFFRHPRRSKEVM